jgi:hypothetical protein
METYSLHVLYLNAYMSSILTARVMHSSHWSLQVLVETTITKEFGFLIKFQLEGDTVYETDLLTYAEEGGTSAISCNYSLSLDLQPSASSRDFFMLQGVEFLLYTQEKTSTSIKTSTFVKPKEAPAVDPKAKKGKRASTSEEMGECTSAVEESSATTQQLCGLVHVDVSSLVKCGASDTDKELRSVCVLTDQAELESADVLPAEWDPLLQRRIVTQQKSKKQPRAASAKSRPPTSSLGKRASIAAAQEAAEGEGSKRTLAYTIKLNVDPPQVEEVVVEEDPVKNKAKGSKKK